MKVTRTLCLPVLLKISTLAYKLTFHTRMVMLSHFLEGTSSQNSSQWRGQIHVDGRNFASYGRSDFATGHRFLGAVNYTYNWTKDKANATTISLIYEGLQGSPYSYVIGGSNARNLNNETGSTSNNRSLIYIPEDRTDINLVDYKVGDVTITADEQWTKLNAYIESDPYLSENRGGYAEKFKLDAICFIP